MRQRGLPLKAKRAIDVLGAGTALLLGAPVIAVVGVSVRIALGSPILFRQRRPGLHGNTFELLKLRTMTDSRDASGNLLPDAQRLTELGKLLRRLSLDELPQLVNVLRGEMSLVGPRPLLPQYLERYTPEQSRRHDVLPGITGWCQINGRNSLSWEEKFRLDVWYVDNWSLALDARILLITAMTFLRKKDISHGAYATMPEFLGYDGTAVPEPEYRDPPQTEVTPT
jgi:lipopolysaccharide/colanic/teichoic acid biosynthesis glycosyltransferase